MILILLILFHYDFVVTVEISLNNQNKMACGAEYPDNHYHAVMMLVDLVQMVVDFPRGLNEVFYPLGMAVKAIGAILDNWWYFCSKFEEHVIPRCLFAMRLSIDNEP